MNYTSEKMILMNDRLRKYSTPISLEADMKHTNFKWTLTAAILTLIATAAYGQNAILAAKIPFAFRAVGSDLPAGSYKINRPPGSSSNSGTMELINVDTGKTIFIPGKAPTTEAKQGRPRLVFQCAGEEGCSLSTLWSGSGSGMNFPTPALTAAQKERRETIYLERFTGK
jgi:hypothetical protein